MRHAVSPRHVEELRHALGRVFLFFVSVGHVCVVSLVLSFSRFVT
jgi:hypothetical protein